MRLLGLLLLAACCLLAGNAASARLKKRVSELEQAMRLLCALEGEIAYTLSPMDVIVTRLKSLGTSLLFLDECVQSCAKGVPFPVAWCNSLRKSKTNMHPEDLQILFDLGAVLGAVDADAAQKELKYASFLLESRYQDAREELQKQGGLYKTLGALAGAAVVVVLL